MARTKKTVTVEEMDTVTEETKKHGWKMTIKIQMIQEILGTAPNNPTIYDDFIASQAPDAASRAQEIEAVGAGEYADRQMTVFLRDEDGDPVICDYQLKGFFKDACSMLKRVPGTKCSQIKAYKKIIDGCLFVYPRFIKIKYEGEMDVKQRSLRASTPQGDRIALASSEMIPEDSEIECEIELLNKADRDFVIECLDYGEKRGLCQWRNAGYGRFVYSIVKEEAC